MSSDEELTWFHVIITTYGAWLPGDERGFRTRHHKQHVEGDYKNPPPPGLYEGLKRYSEKVLKDDIVSFSEHQRSIVGEAIKDKLTRLGNLVIAIAVAEHHAHILVKMPRSKTRIWIGKAKKHVWFELRDHGWKGKLWGKRGKFVPINDRRHQLNVFHYIIRHSQQGAWVWYWDQPKSESVEEPQTEIPKSSEGIS